MALGYAFLKENSPQTGFQKNGEAIEYTAKVSRSLTD